MRFFSLLFSILYFFALNAQQSPDSIRMRAPDYTDVSVLNVGEIYKISTKQTGIYKLTYDYLKNMGVDISNIDVSKIKIYGNGGGRLKQKVDENYIDDLMEIPIYIKGEDDGKFDSGDYILFYGEGADKWNFDNSKGLWKFDKNIYSITNYYFLKFTGEPGKRVTDNTVSGTPQYISGESDIYAVHEEDKINLLGSFIKTEGSGQEWYGENISSGVEKDFSSYFSDFKFIKEKGINYNIIFAGRDANSRKLTVALNDSIYNYNIASVTIANPEAIYAKKVFIEKKVKPDNNKIKIKLKYDGASGWLDKIEVNARASINHENSPIIISDKNAPRNTIAGFKINNTSSGILVWDITNLNKISSFPVSIEGNSTTFVYKTDSSTKFIVFSLDDNFLSPEKYEKVENQNLHAIQDADMLIVYPGEFEEAALKLAEYRTQHNGFNVYAIELQKIFNEFSCGKYDPTAIRDFARMLKIRNNDFNYLLLFGDGSYDARGINTKADNYIPVFETKQSLSPIDSYPYDDYFGLISYGDGATLSGNIDIAVGRMPVRTAEQASIAVQKIIDYETDKKFYGSWKNNVTLSADDVDISGDLSHFDGAEKIYSNIKNKYPVFNINKIYLDAYIQENNAGGQRYPDVNKAINASIFNGESMFIYVGHGGPKGLAQERVLQKVDINSWNNKYKLPLIITATCSFTGFDDPALNTAGEIAFLKEKGGVIALFSTVRAVFSSSNDALMKAIFNTFFASTTSKYKPVGEIMRIAKNNAGGGTDNKRKFFLFGDPALNLNFPKFKVITTKINDKSAAGNTIVDTISALERVKLEGFIAGDDSTIINDFNGEIDITIFDKPTKLKTFANDFEGKETFRKEFYLQKNILFKGRAQVIDGKFSLTLILPKDINYKYGKGKISYYAIDDNLQQAVGYFTKFIIGGTAQNSIVDDKGPEITLYMNDTGFAYGGITDRNPVLLGFLEDESGINITGIGIGHDLSAEMDNNTGDKIILNEFYESELNNFQKGSFRYPLSKLELGKHLIKVEAWDLLNNRSEKIIEFTVIDGNSDNLTHVLNYPNPFSTKTNFSFEHDLVDQELNIVVNIYSMSGKLVKSITKNEVSTGYRISDITWDGTDDYGVKLANGVYLYKIKVFAPEYNINRESKFEKLVILR